MLTKQRIKFIKSLSNKKSRIDSDLFVAEGPKLVEEILHSGLQIESLYAVHDWTEAYKNVLQKVNFPVELITEGELERISSLTTANQVLALVFIPKAKLETVNPENELVLALDDIRDPGNMGTIIRIADWFGIRHIICTESSVDTYNPKVVQATMGSIFRVEVHYCNLQNFLSKLKKDVAVYGTLLNGENIYKSDLKNTGVIVIGNESKGISPEVQKLITHKVMIPSFAINPDSHAESLNASIATAIFCSEIRRRKSNI